jgi:N6-adenosine-specific RNA methylase IME4
MTETEAFSEKYSTIVVAPPWDGNEDPAYDRGSLEQFEDAPIVDLAAKHAHLYLWVTESTLPKGFALLRKWGFGYAKTVTWVKPDGRTELILFATNGKLPLVRPDLPSHFHAEEFGTYSDKPPEFYAIVEMCSPEPRLEMYSRDSRRGWTNYVSDRNCGVW